MTHLLAVTLDHDLQLFDFFGRGFALDVAVDAVRDRERAENEIEAGFHDFAMVPHAGVEPYLENGNNGLPEARFGNRHARRIAETLVHASSRIMEASLITALLQTRLPETVSRQEALEMFRRSAPNYQDTDGLIRKYYLLSEDHRSVGGVYLWESREKAEGVYTGEWREYVKATFGAYPSLTYFDTPLVVDNLSGEIIE